MVEDNFISVGPETDPDALPKEYPWLESTKVVVKPDQLIKRRGKITCFCLMRAERSAWVDFGKNEDRNYYRRRYRLTDHFIVEPL